MRRGAIICTLLLVLSACVTGPATKAPAPGPGSLTGPGFDCRISRVVDGDTVKLACADGAGTSARLMGFDTPETYKPRCRAEYALGKRATRALRAKIAGASDIRLTLHGRDKYDRLLIRLYLDGRDVSNEMIAQGLAVAYAGGKRIDWCARLG